MKDLKISKELVVSVLAEETENLPDDFTFTIDEDYIEISDDGEIQFEYCIYKFAFKCKEWLLNKGYSQLSGKDGIYEKGQGFVCSVGSTTLLIKDFYANTEIETIIQACEWLLEQNK